VPGLWQTTVAMVPQSTQSGWSVSQPARKVRQALVLPLAQDLGVDQLGVQVGHWPRTSCLQVLHRRGAEVGIATAVVLTVGTRPREKCARPPTE